MHKSFKCLLHKLMFLSQRSVLFRIHRIYFISFIFGHVSNPHLQLLELVTQRAIGVASDWRRRWNAVSQDVVLTSCACLTTTIFFFLYSSEAVLIHQKLQWNLSKADTIGAKKLSVSLRCPLHRKHFFSETFPCLQKQLSAVRFAPCPRDSTVDMDRQNMFNTVLKVSRQELMNQRFKFYCFLPGKHLGSNRFVPPNPTDDFERLLLYLLTMIHRRPFLHMRFPPRGAFACIRAVGEDFYDIMFR